MLYTSYYTHRRRAKRDSPRGHAHGRDAREWRQAVDNDNDNNNTTNSDNDSDRYILLSGRVGFPSGIIR